jgi:hypothetical protein
MRKQNNIDQIILKSELYEFYDAVNKYNNKKYLLQEFANPFKIITDTAGEFVQDMQSGFSDAMVEFMVDTIVAMLGINPTTLLGEFFLEIAKEFIENVLVRNPDHIGKYFDDEEGCNYIAEDLITVIGESGADIMIRIFIRYLSSQKFIDDLNSDGDEAGQIELELAQGIIKTLTDSTIADLIVRPFKEAFQGELLEKLQVIVTDTVCSSNFKLSDAFGNYFGFDFGSDEEEFPKEVDSEV